MTRTRAVAVLLMAAAQWSGSGPAERRAEANDNRRAAGRLRGDTLEVRLVVEMARWKPGSPRDSGIVVAAFAEEGRSPTIPAPLLRVREGTTIAATVRNGLADSLITLRGFVTHPGRYQDSVVVAPGATVQLQFAAGEPGTYWYGATVGRYQPSDTATEERQTSLGAFIVDPRGGSPPDRVFVMNIWGTTVDSVTYPNALAINGRSWPWNERITAEVGDSLRWRWINATLRNHPMHLHGFYFRLESRGNGMSDRVFPAGEQPLLVTHDTRAFETYTLAWSPDRPGNWLYHCHIGFHVIAGAADLHPEDSTSHHQMSSDPRQHMAGLVLGLVVNPPRRWRAPARTETRRLELFVQEGRPRGHAPRALGFVLQRGSQPPAADSVEIPGSTLVLTRGQPTDVVVRNRLREPAIIHWHGIELESYSDGVAGWSGDGRRMAPIIQPRDSFVARLSLPRAGTFMYHTHFNDIEQLTSGMYGGLVVLEPGQRFDPATDHLYVGGWDGPEDPPRFLINGDSLPGTLEIRAGVPHRFRFVNIGPAAAYWPALRKDTTLVQWRAVARDGADLPAALATLRPATLRVQVGETADFEWIPGPGTYTLGVGIRFKPAWVQTIVVR